MPAVARQTISSPRNNAIAAPVAALATRACSTISLRMRSRASSAETDPPPCSARIVAKYGRSYVIGGFEHGPFTSAEGFSSMLKLFSGSDRNMGC